MRWEGEKGGYNEGPNPLNQHRYRSHSASGEILDGRRGQSPGQRDVPRQGQKARDPKLELIPELPLPLTK